jgi:hypothetical protein
MKGSDLLERAEGEEVVSRPDNTADFTDDELGGGEDR